jgi:hypothetical protein
MTTDGELQASMPDGNGVDVARAPIERAVGPGARRPRTSAAPLQMGPGTEMEAALVLELASLASWAVGRAP